MLQNTRLDTKLEELARELTLRQLIPGYQVVEAYATRGLDDAGKPGLFAAVLLKPEPVPDLGVLTSLRSLLTQKLKQIDTWLPSYPVVVQGAPEVIDAHSVIPGGTESFTQVKADLLARRSMAMEAEARAQPQPVTVTLPKGLLPEAPPRKTTRKPARKAASGTRKATRRAAVSPRTARAKAKRATTRKSRRATSRR